MAETITDDPDRRQFELHVDGELAALITYGRKGTMLALTHTETRPGFERRGYAKKLVEHVLATAREEGTAILPFCPYVRQYLVDHPDQIDLVPEHYHAHFDLVGAPS